MINNKIQFLRLKNDKLSTNREKILCLTRNGYETRNKQITIYSMISYAFMGIRKEYFARFLYVPKILIS